MYRVGRRSRRHTLGKFPTLGLADARDRARKALLSVADGHDPARQKVENRDALTFGLLAADYMKRYSKIKKRSWREDQRIIDVYLSPHLEHVIAKDVKRPDVRIILEKIAATAPVMANRVRAVASKIFSWAASQGLIENNPCNDLERPTKEQSRDRHLSASEIKVVWWAIDGDARFDPLRLILITGQRPGEVANMRWQDVEMDEGVWILPGKSVKNGKTHRVPLSAAALRILRIRQEERDVAAQPSDWVFERPRRKDTPLTKDDVIRLVRRVRGQICDETPESIEAWTAHDLRRTAATMMTTTGIADAPLVDRILNHSPKGVIAIYDRYQYFPQMKEALEAWGRQLTILASDLRSVEGSAKVAN